eukprot:9110362-Pyramimonas_sp.AAC.1
MATAMSAHPIPGPELRRPGGREDFYPVAARLLLLARPTQPVPGLDRAHALVPTERKAPAEPSSSGRGPVVAPPPSVASSSMSSSSSSPAVSPHPGPGSVVVPLRAAGLL